jgi:TrmH family RNA methyltransferase
MIESIQNKQVKQLVALQKTKKERAKKKTFVIEGIKIIQEIPIDWEIDTIFVSSTFLLEHEQGLQQLMDRSQIIEVSDKIFMQISDTQTPQGILAVCKQKCFSINEIIKKPNPFLVMVEEMQDPGNLGTLIRTADAAGADGVILSKGTVDLYNPKVLRATMGSVFHLPIVAEANLEEVLVMMKQEKIQVLSAHLRGDRFPYDCDLTQSTAILIGNEANGIKESTANMTDQLIKLPMLGKAESLNAAIASGILMYELVRQRI